MTYIITCLLNIFILLLVIFYVQVKSKKNEVTLDLLRILGFILNDKVLQILSVNVIFIHTLDVK